MTNIDTFHYELPEEYIAKYPLEKREHSKLLTIQKGKIVDDVFYNVHKHISKGTTLFFNNTKVVKARLFLKKDSGAIIEFFCLNPVFPTTEINMAFSEKGTVVWECMIGNAKKWKEGPLIKNISLYGKVFQLTARLKEKTGQSFLIEFSWNNTDFSFGEILDSEGQIPLPPYLNRKTEASDSIRYQTVYASENGSVAAPTAGLHFTSDLLTKIKNECSDVKFEYLTLHVGAGTFKPISGKIDVHIMHSENIFVTLENIVAVYNQIEKGHILAVGTTTLRTLESLYWIGVNIIKKTEKPFYIKQLEPYENTTLIYPKEAINALLSYMKKNQLENISAVTSIMIKPGYEFRIVNKLLTNFHQPKSSLILLVAAFIGKKWEDVYNHAIQNNYRFLSYGDACLFDLEKKPTH